MPAKSWTSARVMPCLLLTVAVGCTDADLAHVQGNVVTQGGKPLVGARVIARSTSTGAAVRGGTDADGHFELSMEGADGSIPPGDYAVIVVEDLGAIDSQRAPSIARRYRDASSSGLSFQVEPGEEKEVSWTLDPP